jgi:L-threonylcarbamoyladenylate synthase
MTRKRVQGTLYLPATESALELAAGIIARGGLVAFPTETVYGLGAGATDEQAVARIFQAKGRPPDNPLIVHIASLEQLPLVAREIPREAYRLAELFWPGPLSLVLYRSQQIPPGVSAGLPTVAVRMPNHPVALGLIKKAGVPIAAPSANRSGRPSPTSAFHVLEDLAGRIEAVLDGGRSLIGVESTVLDLTAPQPTLLRPGGVTRERLEVALGRQVVLPRWDGTSPPPSPGMKYRHYAPRAPLIVVVGSEARRHRLARSLLSWYERQGLKVGYLNPLRNFRGSLDKREKAFARSLYAALRAMDKGGADLIVAEGFPACGWGAVIMNRLCKAASRVIRVV